MCFDLYFVVQAEWDDTDLERKQDSHTKIRDECESKFGDYVKDIEKLGRSRKLAKEKRLEARQELEEELASEPESLARLLKEWEEEEQKIRKQERNDDLNKGDSSQIPELRKLANSRQDLEV